MHEAFYPIRLIRNNHYEFESISCFQNYLLIGTKTGQILFYEITPSVPRHPKAFIGLTAWPATTPSRPTEFTPLVEAESVDSVPSPLPSFNVRICATHNLCKKRVLQLQAVPEHGFFLALTEFQLAAYQLSDRQLIAVVPNSKGATHFAVMYQQPAASAKKQVSANTSLDKLKRRSNHTEEVALPSADDTSTLALNLCICVKRKLGFFRWSPLKKAFVSPSEANDPRIAFWPSEYTLPESARMLQFCGLETIIVALRSDYLRINLSTRESQVIVTPAKMSITLTAPLPYCLDAVTFDEEPQHLPDDATATPETKWVLGASAPVALASDEQLFTLLPGNADATATLAFDWSGIAQCLQPFPPYLLAGLSKQLEVRCLDPCDLVQTFAIPRVRLMCANDSGWLYAVAASSIFHPDDSQPDLSVKPVESPSAGHGSDVWLLLAANRPQLVQNLALKKDFEMALKVACFTRLSGQSPVSTSQLGALLAFHLFDEKRDFEGAFQLFYKLRTDPTIVIGLCPDLLREEDQARAQYPSAPRPLEDAEKKALLEPLIAFLVRWRNHLRSKCPRGDSLANFLAQSVACGVIVGRGPVEKQRSALLQVVDTSLVKCYLLTNVARVGPLLRRENYCHLEEVEKILTAHNCYEDLVTMYRARGMHRSALRCLTVMALGNDASQDTFAVSSDNRANHQPIVNYLKHLSDAPFDLVAEFGEWILRQHPRAWMSIFTAWERGLRHSASESKTIAYHDKAVRYLERVAPHLIIPFLERLIFTPFDCEQEDEEEEEGFEVLNGTAMFDNEGSEPDDFVAINGSPPPSSPSVRSLQAVTSTPKVLHGESSHAPAAHLVASNHGSTSSLSTATGSTHWQSSCLWPFPKHHHHLHRPRRCDVEQEGDSGNDGIPRICQPPPGAPPPVELHNRYARALIRQIQSSLGDDEMANRVVDEKPADGLVACLRRRLLAFLSAEDAHFSAEDLLPRLPYDACFDERAALLARLRRHKQALTMWIHLLDSWDQALQYCAKIQAEAEQTFLCKDSPKRRFLSSAEGADRGDNHLLEIYTTLVDVCLNPLEPIALGIIPTKRTSDTTDTSPNPTNVGLDFRFKPRTDLALKAMRQFSELIDATTVLSMVPGDTNLKALSQFLESTVKQQASLQARLVFFMSAAHSESVQSRIACAAATAGQMFKVTALTRCHQCRRRIGTSAFVRHPDSGELVHYGCCRNLPADSKLTTTRLSGN